MGRRQSALLFLALFACGCRPKGTIIVGIDAQPAVATQAGRVHVTASAGAKHIAERDITPKPNESPFPFELRLEGSATSIVDIAVEVFHAGPGGTVLTPPMVVRRARAPFVAGAPKLLRLRLESSCITMGTGFKGPQCPYPQSCASHRCIDPTLLADDLETYVPNWATDRPDVCRPAHAGAPIVMVGTGQTDYLPLKDGDMLTPEHGPQGGHHLWIAVRMKNLHQVGSTITLTAEQPDTGIKAPPTSFVFSFDPDEGGYCKLHGLRFQLDNASVPVARFLGHPLDVKVAVRDTTGRTAESVVRVNVADHTIGG